MPRLTEYKDMNPRAKAVVEGIARGRNIDPANINNVLLTTQRRVRAQTATILNAA
jgi:hypothetical protein